jgi:hypothetical protein
MQRLEVSGEVRPLYVSLGFKGLRGWVGSRAGLNVSEKRSWFTPYRESKNGFSALHPIA